MWAILHHKLHIITILMLNSHLYPLTDDAAQWSTLFKVLVEAVNCAYQYHYKLLFYR